MILEKWREGTHITGFTISLRTRQVRRWRGKRFVFHKPKLGSKIRIFNKMEGE